MKRKRILGFTLLLLVVFSTTAMFAGGSSEEVSTVTKDTLVVGVDREPPNLNVHMNLMSSFGIISTNFIETLVRIDENNNIQPNLAERWTISDNQLEYTFVLEKGIKFHDGKELKAEDVKYSIERIKGSPQTGLFLQTVKSAEVIDDYTVKVILSEPFSPLLSFLSVPYLGIVHQQAVEGLGEQFAITPVGTGPYKVQEWIKGEKIVFKRFDDYRLGPAPIETVEIKIIFDQTTRTIALQNGEIDVALMLEPMDVELLNSNEDITVLKTESTRLAYLGFNNKLELFKNKNLRKAIQLAINKEAVKAIAFNDDAYILEHPMVNPLIASPGDVPGAGYDPVKARKYMEEAGYADGLTLEIISWKPALTAAAEVIQSNLKEIGIDAVINQVEFGYFYEKIFSGDSQLHVGGFVGVGDTEVFSYYRYHSKAAALSTIFVNDPKIDVLVGKGRRGATIDDRKATYRELAKYLIEQAYEVPLLAETSYFACNKNLKGAYVSPQIEYNFARFSW